MSIYSRKIYHNEFLAYNFKFMFERSNLATLSVMQISFRNTRIHSCRNSFCWVHKFSFSLKFSWPYDKLHDGANWNFKFGLNRSLYRIAICICFYELDIGIRVLGKRIVCLQCLDSRVNHCAHGHYIGHIYTHVSAHKIN